MKKPARDKRLLAVIPIPSPARKWALSLGPDGALIVKDVRMAIRIEWEWKY